jgi:hypothetical protein
MRRNVYLEMEYGRIYPNLYVIFVAESAKARKSTAMDYGREMLIEAIPEIRVMRDSMTSQGLIKALNRKVQTIVKTEDGKEVIKEEQRSDVAIFADEVANLFSYERQRAAQMVIFLTRTYTCPTIYDHTTVRDSIVRLHNLYPVLLGGTDPRNLKVLPDDAVGGLTGRLIWVIESTRRANNPGWIRDPARIIRQRLLREGLLRDLQEISKLNGAMTVSDDAQECYDGWYEDLSKKDTKDPDTDAFYHRCHVTGLRLAMLLSISNSSDLVITKNHMEGAIKLIEAQLPEIKRVTVWSGGSQYEQLRAKFIHFLQSQNGMATNKSILKHLGVNLEEYTKIKTTLVADGTIEQNPVPIGRDYVIVLTKEGLGR